MLTTEEQGWVDTYNDLDTRRLGAVHRGYSEVRQALLNMPGGSVTPSDGEPADRLLAAITRYLVESEG